MKTLEKLEEPQDPTPAYEPTGRNTCDVCSVARAYVRVTKTIEGKEKDLEFCAHHYNAFEPSLMGDHWAVQDRRDLLRMQVEAYKNPTPEPEKKADPKGKHPSGTKR